MRTSLTVRWMLPVGVRAAVVTGVVAVLALAAVVTAAPAAAATVDGAFVETQSSLCTSSSLSARTNMTMISPGDQPQVDQDFHLLVTVVGLNQCLSTQQVGVNLQLPAGITVSTTGQSACVTFASSNPAATTTNVPCVRSDAGNGFQRINPKGGSSWSLSRKGDNVVQVQLAVRASTSGERTAFARVCESGSTVICERFARGQRDPERGVHRRRGACRRRSRPDRLLIAENRVVCPTSPCAAQSITSTSIKVLASLVGQRPAGTWQIQRGGPGSAPFTTIAEQAMTAGSGGRTFATTATGLQPNTTYKFRACYVPTGAAQVCGAEIQLTTSELSRRGGFAGLGERSRRRGERRGGGVGAAGPGARRPATLRAAGHRRTVGPDDDVVPDRRQARSNLAGGFWSRR